MTEPGASPIHPMAPDAERLGAAASMFRLMSDETRLNILWLLTEGERDVAGLNAACPGSRTSISQHLAKLRLAGMVDARRQGRRVLYRLTDGHLVRLLREGYNAADHRVTGEAHHR
ncbi:ArsR/SmtB family transcription factor [Arthrobacter sp. KK5.5]|uniref:ArsR/SmtB family transcription factor n=1 Tax=Arthrobacter sp. KK5.5 TaxID=3373084 RepID=UPI003EE75CDC